MNFMHFKHFLLNNTSELRNYVNIKVGVHVIIEGCNGNRCINYRNINIVCQIDNSR